MRTFMKDRGVPGHRDSSSEWPVSGRKGENNA